MKTNQPNQEKLARGAMNMRPVMVACLMLASIMGTSVSSAEWVEAIDDIETPYIEAECMERTDDAEITGCLLPSGLPLDCRGATALECVEGVEPPECEEQDCFAVLCVMEGEDVWTCMDAENPLECQDDCELPVPCGDECSDEDPCEQSSCEEPDPCTGSDCEPNRPFLCELGDANPFYNPEECGPLDPPQAGAAATIEKTNPADKYTCSGTKNEIASGTVSATFGGGAFVPASVEFSATVSLLIAWDFACDYSMFAQAWGAHGSLREVHVQTWIGGQYVDAWRPCNYDGTAQISCETEKHAVMSDAFTGSGVAGPGGSGIDPVKLPEQVKICPNEAYSTVRAFNKGMVVTAESAQNIDAWSCKSFAIHYGT